MNTDWIFDDQDFKYDDDIVVGFLKNPYLLEIHTEVFTDKVI